MPKDETTPRVNWGQAALSLLGATAMFICTVVLFNHSESIALNKERAIVNAGEITHIKTQMISPKERRDLCTSIAMLEQAVADLRANSAKLELMIEKVNSSR